MEPEELHKLLAKRTSKSRRKGKKYQKKIAEIISGWWTGQPKNFRSTPGSGGWDKGIAPGDLIPAKGFEEFPFSVECKKRRKAKLEVPSLLNPDSALRDWWAQTCNDADRSGKLPLLIYSQDFGDNYILYLYNQKFAATGIRAAWPVLKIQMSEGSILIYLSRLDDFIKANPPESPTEGYRTGYLRWRSTPEGQRALWDAEHPGDQFPDRR